MVSDGKWYLAGIRDGDFPKRNISFFEYVTGVAKEYFRCGSETEGKYVRRFFEGGKFVTRDDRIFSLLGDVGLEFKLERCDDDHLCLSYQGWHESKSLLDEKVFLEGPLEVYILPSNSLKYRFHEDLKHLFKRN